MLDLGMDESACESSCTSYGWCIAYSAGLLSKECYLITSAQDCSVGMFVPGNRAVSMDELVPLTVGSGNSRNCKGKAAGNRKYIWNK